MLHPHSFQALCSLSCLLLTVCKFPFYPLTKVKEGIGFAIEKATVSIDGKVVVKDGKLVMDKLSAN
jgi:hypothetical protein